MSHPSVRHNTSYVAFYTLRAIQEPPQLIKPNLLMRHRTHHPTVATTLFRVTDPPVPDVANEAHAILIQSVSLRKVRVRISVPKEDDASSMFDSAANRSNVSNLVQLVISAEPGTVRRKD